MAIPADDSAWPPAPWGEAYKAWREHETLWIGDAEAIAAFYSGGRPLETHDHAGVRHTGGVVGWLSSKFWGQAVPEGEIRTREHVGWAGDLTSLSADLLFAEPPRISFDAEAQVGDGAKERLDLIANSDEARAGHHEGAELASLHGAVALTVRWDVDVVDHAWLAPSGADVSIPEFRNGILSALTLWTEYVDGGAVWRHLERHERGRIMHLLFKGTKDNIGKQRDLRDRPETEHLASTIAGRDGLTALFETNTKRLTASWWRNAPSKAWRRKGVLAEAGRSDLTPAVRALGDSLDEIYSSWLKDIRLGAAKLLIPEAYLDQDDEGGFAFDRGRELVRKVNAPGTLGSLSESIEKVQFEIRTEEHERSALAWWKRMLGTAGYGELDAETEGVQKTATEATFGQGSKQTTRMRKALYAAPAMADAYGACLAIDGQLFRGKGGGDFVGVQPVVAFPAKSNLDPVAASQVVSTFRAAGVMSVEIGVKAAHPDWDKGEVDEEVKRLRNAAPQDPTKLGASRPTDAEEAAARARLGIDTTQPGGGAANAARAAAEAAAAQKGSQA